MAHPAEPEANYLAGFVVLLVLIAALVNNAVGTIVGVVLLTAWAVLRVSRSNERARMRRAHRRYFARNR